MKFGENILTAVSYTHLEKAKLAKYTDMMEQVQERLVALKK